MIDPVDDGADASPGLAETERSFTRLSGGDTTFPRILAHVPGYAEAMWGAMSGALFEGAVDHRLKEIIRIRLARTAGDPYFSNLRSTLAADSGLTEELIEAGCSDFETDQRFDDAEKWALRYASRMYVDPAGVDASFYDQGKRHFTEAQIMELGGLIALFHGMAVFMSTLHHGEAGTREPR
jgi:alkylhydroperoxidase family enzyme